MSTARRGLAPAGGKTRLRQISVRAAHAALEPGGLFWISYPKGSSKVPTDLNRDVFWEALEHLGVRPVTQVSVDEVWSALRFRPFAEVGSR